MPRPQRLGRFGLLIVLFGLALGSFSTAGEDATKCRLYVATPGIRDLLEYGGHGLLVFDIDNAHSFVKRIPTAGLRPDGKPDNVKGICASEITKRLYISTTKTITCLDLLTNSILWEKEYEGGCDRMSLSPDGKTIYAPSFEKDNWNVIDAISGAAIAKIVPKSGRAQHDLRARRQGSLPGRSTFAALVDRRHKHAYDREPPVLSPPRFDRSP